MLRITANRNYVNGNRLTWAGTFVEAFLRGVYYDSNNDILWLSDRNGNRLLRVYNPFHSSVVTHVIGQLDNDNLCEYHCSGGPVGDGFKNPWNLNVDKKGSFYVVERDYEASASSRVLRFNYDSLLKAECNYALVVAEGVYVRKGFTTNGYWSDKEPMSVANIDFDSRNRMLLTVEAYNSKYRKMVFVYPANHADKVTPRPEYVVPIVGSQIGYGLFWKDDEIILQDHTWNRVMFLKYQTNAVGPTK